MTTKGALGRRVLLGAALAVLTVAGPALAEKKAASNVEVLVVLAETVAGATAPDAPLGLKQLKNPPFNGYNRFTQVGDKQTLPLDAKAPPRVSLPNGAPLVLTPKGEGPALQIVPSLSGKELPAIAPKVDEPFFIAGQSYKGGILVVVVTPRG